MRARDLKLPAVIDGNLRARTMLPEFGSMGAKARKMDIPYRSSRLTAAAIALFGLTPVVSYAQLAQLVPESRRHKISD